MLKKILLACSTLFFLAAPLPAQVTPKVLLVIGSQPANAVNRALQLKKAGIEVAVVFEREAIFFILSELNVQTSAGWPAKMEALAAEYAVETSTNAVRGLIGGNTPLHPKFMLLNRRIGVGPGRKLLLPELKKASIPYTVCSFSAKMMFEVYTELKGLGEPMSPDPDVPVDLSPYLTQGYQLIVY